MNREWLTIPFAVHRASRMQVLLGHATAIPPLLEAMETRDPNFETIRQDFLEVLDALRVWENSFASDGMLYQPITPSELDLPTPAYLLPDACFDFVDVTHANSLTHCWAFRIVCLLQLHSLENRPSSNAVIACAAKQDRLEEIASLCTMICQGLPYLLQREMSLYGSMSAGFPLHMVSESLQTLPLQDCKLASWCTAIREQVQSQRVAFYEEMAESRTVV